MKKTISKLIFAGLTVVVAAFGADDTPYQVNYASNLNIGDSYVVLSNTGASSTLSFPTQNGNLCVNVYTYDPAEELVSCCACQVTPNALASLSVRNDLISNTLTPATPTSVTIKLLASIAASTGTACNAATVGTGANVLATGMVAWATTLSQNTSTTGYELTRTAFTPSTLSAAELSRMTLLCGFIQANGSGFGICKSCRAGGLGGARQ